MSAPRAGRSLFWVMAGALLLTFLVGTVAQTLVVDAVLRPLEARELRTRARLAISRIAGEIATRRARPDDVAIRAMMRAAATELELRFVVVIYRDREGWVVAEPGQRGRAALSWLARGAPEPPPEGRRPRGGPPRVFSVLAREAATWNGQPVGELIVLRPERPPGVPLFSRALLLSLPIALLTSLVIGLIIVRMLVRRLRALETLASQVAEGDLTVRVDDRTGDEIGRLAHRLNTMTEHLAEARRSVDEHEAQRQKLFADITHELATPLTSIRGCTETLLDPQVSMSPEERARYLEDILAESRRMDRLIRDLFELARLEAGASPLEPEELDWVALCRNVAHRFAKRFEAAGLTLRWRDSEHEAWIKADGHRMEQVLENLLRNALRYVPSPGQVTLAVSKVAGAAGDRYRLTVEDDGPGMALEEIPHLFERFYRATGARGRDGPDDLGGSGLGLAIVREIVQQHAGTATATPRQPRGLAVEIEIPALQR